MTLSSTKIQKLREGKGLTQSQMSEQSGLNRSLIARTENKNVENIAVPTLLKYLNSIGYDLYILPIQSSSTDWQKLID